MKKSLFSFCILCLCSVLNVSAQETFKVRFYNLLNYPLEDAVPNREQEPIINNCIWQITGTRVKREFNVSNLQNGLYFLVVPRLNLNPLKFIISN